MVDSQFLKNKTIGISVSEHTRLAELGFGNMHVQDALIEISRYLLSCGGNLAYGGDITYKPDFNFVEILFQLVAAYNHENTRPTERVKNYSAFPIYNKITLEQKRDYDEVAEFIKVEPPEDLDLPEKLIKSTTKNKELNKEIDSLFREKNVEDNYIWARTMTKMRMQMNNDIQARVVLGGKTSGYKGIYPGLIEESYYAIKSKMPVYLIGGFGGASAAIVELLNGRKPKELTSEFQFESTQYKELFDHYNQQAKSIDSLESADFDKITKFFIENGEEDDSFGLNNGLSREENATLFNSVQIPELIGLILKGMNSIFKQPVK